MKEITFNGLTFEYDEKALRRYDVQKYIATATENLSNAYKVIEIIFAGRDLEYAQMLDNDDAAMSELLKAAVQDATEGNDADARAVKN